MLALTFDATFPASRAHWGGKQDKRVEEKGYGNNPSGLKIFPDEHRYNVCI